MFCHVCGKTLNDGAQICSYCGAKVVIPRIAEPNAPAEMTETGMQKLQDAASDGKELAKPIPVSDGAAPEELSRAANASTESKMVHAAPWKRMGKKVLSWIGNVFWFLLMVIAGVIGKAAAHDPNVSRTMAYVLPGAMAGLVAGIVCCILASSFSKLSHKKAWMFASVLGCILAGIIGGYVFAAGAGVVFALLLFVVSR